jgi:autotransporter-associated beta strand protein
MPDAPPYQTHGPLVPGDPLYVCRHADDDLKEGVLAGGLTRSGAGMLTLSSAPAYTGNTVHHRRHARAQKRHRERGGILTVNAPGTLQARSIVNRAIAPAPGAQAIPEPGFTLLLSAGLLTLFLPRRR